MVKHLPLTPMLCISSVIKPAGPGGSCVAWSDQSKKSWRLIRTQLSSACCAHFRPLVPFFPTRFTQCGPMRQSIRKKSVRSLTASPSVPAPICWLIGHLESQSLMLKTLTTGILKNNTSIRLSLKSSKASYRV